MKKLLSTVIAVSIALGTFSGAASASTTHYKKPVIKKKITMPIGKAINGTFNGWSDGSSFEVKTPKGYIVFTSSNHWYFTHLKEGKTYKYFYTTNKYGQNIITQIWK